MCKHKNIEMHQVFTYIIPQGYNKFVESKEPLDFGKYFIEETQDRIVCQDCGETLD